MYCPKCGAQNYDNEYKCSACGTILNQNANQNTNVNTNTNQNQNLGNKNVPNYLVPSILVTLFCCLPLGILSIFTSMKVDEKLRNNDYSGALDASNKAKTYCIISVVCGCVIGIIFFFISLANH